MRLQIEELGDHGVFEIFALMRRVGHRLGLSAWAGQEAASAHSLDRLIPLFEELVSTFGHGRHACPAQRFSISAIRIALRRLLGAYELQANFTRAAPRPRQLGGVARAAEPCPVVYRRRAGSAVR